ncbi:helix-turn-helix transcriptional regulator [Clostridium sp. D33t1_170424_F3]|uniref:helix-turn-helix domain-containing protein n=1 Tax=Clostridium sp. D33t1_170424_F3 TaxID=2787099 RepID=UPI0018A917FF
MDSKSFGKKLKNHRAKCGWSQKECAEKIGISTRYLADIERGDKIPTLETFVLILNTLTASADDVLQDSLSVGYQSKSNDLLKKLESVDVSKRKQVLDIFNSVITSLKDN